jgi:hypothetical protein
VCACAGVGSRGHDRDCGEAYLFRDLEALEVLGGSWRIRRVWVVLRAHR